MLSDCFPKFAACLLTVIIWLTGINGYSQSDAYQSVVDRELRTSPVSFHLSFDNPDFLQEEFIELSGRRSLEQRKIDFPIGRFGQAIRTNFIPDPPDAHNMTGIDLDLVTAAMFNTRPDNTMGYTQPMLWGTGRINPRLGAVAFWAKGEPPFYGLIFEQTSVAFGRTERDLLGVFLDKDYRLGAYLRDASYVRHEIQSDTVWDESEWNHIVLNWDWANGMELWLNGEVIASSWGDGGWFETAPPGLFHLPMPRFKFDELYLMDRPLSSAEIQELIDSNTPPQEEHPVYRRVEYDAQRLARYSGAGQNSKLPEVTPGRAMTFTEVWPQDATDGHIKGWHVIDGRNEMAWPHPYAFFTVIPGDADFHAEKVDLQTPAGSKVNYVALTGNLTDVQVLAGSLSHDRQTLKNGAELFSVPEGPGFFYGSTITTTKGSTFRIPFTEEGDNAYEYSFEGAEYRIPYNEEFGNPTRFKGDVNLPLSGKKRIQNVGLYHYSTSPADQYRPPGITHTLTLTDELGLDERMQFKLHAATSRDERTFAVASGGGTVESANEMGSAFRPDGSVTGGRTSGPDVYVMRMADEADGETTAGGPGTSSETETACKSATLAHGCTGKPEDRGRGNGVGVTTGPKGNVQVAAATGGEPVDIGAFARLNLLSEPYYEETGVSGVTLSLPVKTTGAEETLFVRVRDPALPLRLWNQFAFRLAGFDEDYSRLVLTIDFQDLVLTGGDRLWVDLGTAGETQILLGDEANPAEFSIHEVDSWRAVDAYSDKQMMAASAQYAKMYGYMPWKFTGRTVSLENPYALGGPFDMILPAQAVKRVNPGHFLANFMLKMSSELFRGGHPVEPENRELITLTDPHGAPGWAVYMRDYNHKRQAVVRWWLEHQNPDGQIGGGWNDDNLFMISGLKDLLFDSPSDARNLHDAMHTGFEATQIYSDGYCRLYPMDRMHDADFISERYNTVMHNLGQPHAAEREMQSAWRLGKPEKTPVNYSEGLPFLSSVNVFHWYWGEYSPEVTYESIPLGELEDEFRLYSSLLDEFYFYSVTGSRIHTTTQGPYGSRYMYGTMLGGSHGPRWDARPDLAVMWPAGGGPDVARVVLLADDTTFEAAAYSFDERKRNLQMRLTRIQNGRYRVGIYADPGGTGQAGESLWSTEKELARFDVVELPLPPRTPLVIRVEQIERFGRPDALPDLAINPWGAVYRDGTVTATVHNLGNAEAENITVRLLDGETVLQETVIGRLQAPTDFIPRRISLTFDDVPASRNLKVIIDPVNEIREILKENNSAPVVTGEDCCSRFPQTPVLCFDLCNKR